jgi:hypothetical protein
MDLTIRLLAGCRGMEPNQELPMLSCQGGRPMFSAKVDHELLVYRGRPWHGSSSRWSHCSTVIHLIRSQLSLPSGSWLLVEALFPVDIATHPACTSGWLMNCRKLPLSCNNGTERLQRHRRPTTA